MPLGLDTGAQGKVILEDFLEEKVLYWHVGEATRPEAIFPASQGEKGGKTSQDPARQGTLHKMEDPWAPGKAREALKRVA